MTYPLDSERVTVKTEAYPGRWTTHFVISRSEELDMELLEWIQQAYDYSDWYIFDAHGILTDLREFLQINDLQVNMAGVK